MAQEHNDRLTQAGWTLPAVHPPRFNYVASIAVGDIVYFAGKTPPPEFEHRGRLGDDIDIDTGRLAAQATALHCLAQVEAEYGLGNVKRLLKLTGFVAATADFTSQPQVIDAASDVFTTVLGEAGRHTRSAIGVASLPGGWPVELEITVLLTPQR